MTHPSSPTSQLPSQSPYAFVFLEVFSQEGGIQSYVKDILQGYAALEEMPPADVFLLRDSQECSNPLKLSPSFRFHYFKTQSATLDRVQLAIALLVYLLRHRPQHVFCGHIKLAPLVQWLCQPLGIPYTVLTYGKEVWVPLPKPARRALQHANTIWTISRYSRDQACKANSLDPQLFQILPCAVDGDRFTPGAKSTELVHQYGLANTRVLITVARLWTGDRYKGVDVTIQALPTIAQTFPDVKYLVVGRGDDQPRLAQLAQNLGVGDRVIFTGFVPIDALIDHYRLAEVYVMPSQEGFGIAYLEAMACGKPVLAGDADGSADPLQDGHLGWRVPHRDPQAVAQACIEILKELSLPSKTRDRRCHEEWLRQQTIALFGQMAFTHQLATLLTAKPR